MNATNTFDSNALLALEIAIDVADIDGVLVKRSVDYTAAIVVGRPNKPRTFMVSQLKDETDKDGQWFLTAFPLHHPKEVAHAEIPFESGYCYHFKTWEEVVAFAIGYYR